MSSILPEIPKDNGPLLLGAGGLANGSQVAAFLTLGAAGAVLGTRFLLTPESSYTDAQRSALISAGVGSTVRTLVFDRARGTTGWPQGVDGRAIRNQTVEDADAGVDMEEVKQKFLEGARSGDHSRMLVWAGEGVALMNEVQGAKVCTHRFAYSIIWSIVELGGLILFFSKDLMETLHREIVQSLQSTQSLLDNQS